MHAARVGAMGGGFASRGGGLAWREEEEQEEKEWVFAYLWSVATSLSCRASVLM